MAHRDAPASRTAWPALLLGALVVAVAGFLLVAADRHGTFDLKIYYGALNHWVNDGGMLYDFLKPGTRYGFTYPPFAALLMAPMAYVSLPVAVALTTAATVVTTAVVLWWLVDPVSRRERWPRWFAFGVALCLVAAFEPMRETVTFGQINMLLLGVVAADLLWLVARGHRWAGVGVGLATAVKLTPGIFLVYLLVTRRWRAAATASGAAAVVTLLAAAVAPDASREFWTTALWNTDRVGDLFYVSNQSLQGVVARLSPAHPSTALWLGLVAAALAVWVWRVRTAVAAGDEAAGLALTAVVGCLVSPVTWVHHLVWLIPALLLLADSAVCAPAASARRRRLSAVTVLLYVVLSSGLVWRWDPEQFGGVDGFLGSNAYVWAGIVLLLALPVGDRRRAGPGSPAGAGPSAEVDRVTHQGISAGGPPPGRSWTRVDRCPSRASPARS
jgi:alpha-1,2-mannosyltransferase